MNSNSRPPLYPNASNTSYQRSPHPSFAAFSFPTHSQNQPLDPIYSVLPSYRPESSLSSNRMGRRRSSVYRVAGEYYYTEEMSEPFTTSQNLPRFNHLIPSRMERSDTEGNGENFGPVRYQVPTVRHDFQNYYYSTSEAMVYSRGLESSNGGYRNYLGDYNSDERTRMIPSLRIETESISSNSNSVTSATGTHPSFTFPPSDYIPISRNLSRSSNNTKWSESEENSHPSYRASSSNSSNYHPSEDEYIMRNDCNPSAISPGPGTQFQFELETERSSSTNRFHSPSAESSSLSSINSSPIAQSKNYTYTRTELENDELPNPSSLRISKSTHLVPPSTASSRSSTKRTNRDSELYIDSPSRSPSPSLSPSPISPLPSPPKPKKASTAHTSRSTRLAGVKNVFHPSPISMLASTSESNLHQKKGPIRLPTQEEFEKMPTKKSRGRTPRIASAGVVEMEKKKAKGKRKIAGEGEEEGFESKKGKKVFICGVPDCLKQFKRSEHLKRHVRSIHTDERPYLCRWTDCGKRFSRHDNLSQHLRVHREENQTDADFSLLVKKAFGEHGTNSRLEEDELDSD